MCELLEKAKENSGLSYYKISREIGISDQLMTRWKRKISKPNGLHTLKLANLAGIGTKEAIKIVEKGFIELSLILVTGLSSIALLALFRNTLECILCKIIYAKKVLANLFKNLL